MKKKIYYVLKKDIIQALKTEPLMAGAFAHTLKYEQELPLDCSVCAVGAVIRRKFTQTSYSNFIRICYKATDDHFKEGIAMVPYLLKEKNYLGALSTYFESVAYPYTPVGPMLRADLVKFVRKNFPSRVRITL